MKNFLALAAGAALLSATPSLAQEAVQATPGMKVSGPQGGDVGLVESVSNGVVVVDTGKNKAALPTSAFAKTDAGLSISMTKTDLDAAVEKAAADAQAKLLASLTPGTEVKSINGTAIIGTISDRDEQYVTVAHGEGQEVQLPVASFMMQGEGIAIAMTADQFKQAVASVQ